MSFKHKLERIYFEWRGAVTCQEMENLAYDFLEGKLDERTTRAIEKHMKLCPPCISFIESYRRVKALGDHEPPPPLAPEFKTHLKKFFEE